LEKVTTMKIIISKPEYQILSDSNKQFKVQMKSTEDASVPNHNIPQSWSDLDAKGEWGNSNSVAFFKSVAEAEAFIEKLELDRKEKEKGPPPESWQVVKRISSKD